MDVATFSQLPIVAGEGRGFAVVGATFDQLRTDFGVPTVVNDHDDRYCLEWHPLGLQAWMSKKDDRAVAIALLNGDPASPELARVDGRTDGDIGFGANEDAIVAAFGDPRTVERGTDSARLVYDGIAFRLVGNRLVAMVIEKKRAPEPSPGHRNPELEAAIAANPDDDDAYLVYADWLQQHSDPLGEFIVGHHRHGDAYIEAHQTDMLDLLADYTDMLSDVVWKNGFIHKVKVANSQERSPEHDGELEEFPVEELLAILLDSDAGRFVRDLTIGIVEYHDNRYSKVMKVIGTRRLRALRTLYIGDFDSDDTELNWSKLGNAGVLYAGIPNVESLTLRSGTMSFGAIVLPELRRFATITGGLKKDAIESIANAQWPKLERLALQLGSGRYYCDIEPADLQPIFDGNGLPPSLVHLGLANYEHTDEIIPLLARSKILPRIRELDLSQGTLGAEGVRALIDHNDAFAHLARLDLSESWIDPDAVKAVTHTLPNAIVDRQRYNAHFPDDRYIAGGE